jgi:hypothetical protein
MGHMSEPNQTIHQQPTEKARKTVSRHETPAQVWPNIRKEAVSAMRVGRSAKGTADEYCLTQPLALELYIRAELERVCQRLDRLEDGPHGMPTTRRRMYEIVGGKAA